MRYLSLVLVAFGAVLVVSGVACWSAPAALVVAGGMALVAGLDVAE